ncbi:methyltransferase [Streptomyces sp. NRRL B-1568]|nr:methyltransferase [Streptomyces sp. NRRL B-1568]
MTAPETTAESLSPVSRTALAVARVRALESERPDALFNDPYAGAFVAAARYTRGTPGPFAAALRFRSVIRTRFYDDYLLAACAAGCRQVVLPAAGLDTRAYRLPWPEGVRLYELDLPPVLAFKEGVLAGQDARPRCERITLAVDLLAQEWPGLLAEAGFDPAAPTAWLAEGLLVYLTAAQASAFLGTVGELSAPGSRLALEQGRSSTGAASDPSLAHITGLWHGGLGPGTGDWLREHGWLVETHELGPLAVRYGRTGTGPAGGGFHTAIRP